MIELYCVVRVQGAMVLTTSELVNRRINPAAVVRRPITAARKAKPKKRDQRLGCLR